MSVDFSKLPLEEVLLLEAVEAMCGQYGGAHLLPLKAEAVLEVYGLYLDLPRYEIEGKFIELQEQANYYKKQIGYGSTGANWKSDRVCLNDRSQKLLIILAGLVYEILKTDVDDRELVIHNFMSAGETACFQLVAYSLLVAAPFGGYCNEEGRQFAATMLKTHFSPQNDFAFDGIK